MTSFSDSGAAATRTHSRMALELQATAIASSTVSIAAPVRHGPPVSIRRRQSRFAASSPDLIDNGG
jgi:hypothetical protein